MNREEVLQAIKSNSAGFFGFTLEDGKRRTIRTLDSKEFMEFYDSVKDDNVWIMHARIPSRGETNLENVHGWEEEGIIFTHNMTISAIDGMMKRAEWGKTDSEFFFRHIFMPFYRGCGKDAYKDGALHPDLDNLVRHFCGLNNKFLFIMPDNKVLTFGEWHKEETRQENGKCAFYASNLSYKVYKPAWPEKTEPPKAWPAPKMHPYNYCDDWEGEDDEVLAKRIYDVVGAKKLCELALCDIVSTGLVEAKSAQTDGLDADDAKDVKTILENVTPSIFDLDTLDVAVEGLKELADNPEYTLEDFAKAYAEVLVNPMATVGHGGFILKEFDIAEAIEGADRDWRIFSRVAMLKMDFTAKKPADLFRAEGYTQAEVLDAAGMPDKKTMNKGIARILKFFRKGGAK